MCLSVKQMLYWLFLLFICWITFYINFIYCVNKYCYVPNAKYFKWTKTLSMDCISFIFNNKKIIYICSLFSLFYLILAALPAIAWASPSLARKTRPGHGTNLIKENWPKQACGLLQIQTLGPCKQFIQQQKHERKIN